MSWLPALVLLQTSPPQGSPGPGLFQLTPFLLIGLIFYFLLIRPQQKQRRDHETLIKGIERGDQVVTSGGLHGKVTGVTDDVLTIEIAALKGERVRVKQDRSRIESVQKAKKGEEVES
jgi:preprotein translocase subunit YajC